MSMNFNQSDIAKKLEEITSAWETSNAEGGNRILLYPAGKNCIWSYGITKEHTFCFFLESPEQFGCGRQLCTKTIQSSEFKNQSIWFLKLELLEITDLSIFIRLMEDLISESMRYETDIECVHAVVARFEKWREMMSHAASHKAEEKGLFGELYVIRELLKSHSAMDVVRAWMGPDYAVQDFKFASSWIEVKTIGSNAFSVKISSIKQLDSPYDGYLYVVRADEDEFDESAESVSSLYKEISTKLKSQSIEAYELFNSKLTEFKYMGFVATEITRFVFKGQELYGVNSDFPKLIAQDTKQAIKSVVYELTLASLQDWRVENGENCI